MGTPRLKFRELSRILSSFGVTEHPKAGKGSHSVFRAIVGGEMVSYPVPTTSDTVLPCS